MGSGNGSMKKVLGEELYSRLLFELGHEIEREGLLETPKRHVTFLQEFCDPPTFKFTTFQSEGYDQMIIQKDIPFYSLCEHHVVPFFGTAVVAYVPKDRIVGLSKLARTVDLFARGLQNQERITEEVQAFLTHKLEPRGVAVRLTARHLCMEMRGVKKAGTETITTSLSGVFLEQEVREEFMSNL